MGYFVCQGTGDRHLRVAQEGFVERWDVRERKRGFDVTCK